MPYKTQPSDDQSGFGTAIRSPIQAEPAHEVELFVSETY